MIRLRPRCWLPLLRVLVLGLFSLGLVVQPVMAAAGEMHELAHDPSGMHDHRLHAEDVEAELAATGEQDGARTLHVLLRFAHCCGATAALLTVLKPVPAKPAPDRLAIAKTAIPPPARLATPFKPPIFG
ncbi:hypothetical protein [Coralloluteibacterium stylophorae]|uniref:DUF2946 domain-containing protein n=1 Tax=Coralloluteibacterium stylophorae TaxID=1776034 RepID=A0A8J7VTZ5_9GAMM|nr:hypothetical protein [Coralloluteibacterium stylophorae]MBS7457925.1 hypothetical protein [Coralloluteibacterium stylophorae]